MKNSNLIKKKISKDDRKVSVNELTKLLAEFFNGVFIQIDEKCSYES